MTCPLSANLDREVRTLIRHKARRLVGHYGFRTGDRVDLEQELALHAHASASRFNPSRGCATTFFQHVLERKACDLVRSRRAVCRRDPQESGALNPVDYRQAGGALLDLKLDVRDALASAPADLRCFARRLMIENQTQAARALGLTRGEARYRTLLLARHLSRAGLGSDGGTFATEGD